MTGIERRRRVIFYAELNSSSHSLACDFGDDTKPEIDTCGHTAPSNHVPIFHHSCLFVCSSDKRQKISIRPVRRSSSPPQQSGHTQNECARANRCDVLCDSRLLTDELDGFTVVDNTGYAFAPSRYADQVERRAICTFQ